MKLLKSRKGFTLVELCVVMAITALVGTMVVSFLMISNGQHAKIVKEAQYISDITDVQKTVDGWLKKYDSSSYNFVISADTKTISAQKKSDSSTVSSLYLSDRKIVENCGGLKEKTDTLQNIKGLTFQRPTYTKDTATVKEQLIRVTIKCDDDSTQTLLFPLFSDITRQRKVENR